jgi:hypothetical protein
LPQTNCGCAKRAAARGKGPRTTISVVVQTRLRTRRPYAVYISDGGKSTMSGRGFTKPRPQPHPKLTATSETAAPP